MKKTKDIIQQEALNAVEGLNRAGIAMSVGTGKTLVGLKHMNQHYTDYAKFLVVAPKRSIWKSWLDESEIHNLGYLKDHIDFTTYLSLPKRKLDYDVVYLDECHSLKYSCEPWLNDFKGKIIGLTGTPPKYGFSEKGKMVNEFCPIKYTYITDDAIEDKLLNDYRIIVHMLELDTIKNIPVHKNGQTWFTSERAGYDYWTNRLNSANTAKEIQIMRVMRMKSLQNLKSKETKAAKLMAETINKIIVFGDTQEQAERLCKHSYHSNNPMSEDNLEQFKIGTIKKLSCVLQLSEGINVPDLKEGIIIHSYGNERKLRQRIGRLMRLNPNDTAIVHILCYKDTVDTQWVKQALEDYDKAKITWV